MRQIAEKTVNHPAPTTSAPSGTDGIALYGPGTFAGVMPAKKWILTLDVGGAGDLKVAIWGRLGTDAAVWGLLGNNAGIVNNGNALAAVGVYHFELENLGGFSHIYVQKGAGTATLAAKLTALLEKGD